MPMCSVFGCNERNGHRFPNRESRLKDLQFGQIFAKENHSVQDKMPEFAINIF